MAATTVAIPQQRLGDIGTAMPPELSLKMTGTSTILDGTIVVIDAGYAKEGVTGTSLITAGVAYGSVTNSGAAGAANVLVRPGVYKMKNATAGDAILQAHVGTVCYVLDNQTLTITSTGRSKAGMVIRVDSDGVVAALGNQAIGL